MIDHDSAAVRLISLRRNHPAWLLLASTNGPLILASLRALIDAHPGGIDYEQSVEHLAAAMERLRGRDDFDVDEDPTRTARRELREWIRRRLIVERDGQLIATDALQQVLTFLDSLDGRTMTSTASRLATVQRAIESLHLSLSEEAAEREAALTRQIEQLEAERERVRRREFNVLAGPRAEQDIREVHTLAVSLRADFRRVEDSFRAADRQLRETILQHDKHRGQIVEELLDGHDALLETPEGQVFDGFHRQLVREDELAAMKSRLDGILNADATRRALSTRQRSELRGIVGRLLDESRRVIEARAQSERDVRGFLKTGLADENLRVAALISEIRRVALAVDWADATVRRSESALPPVAVSLNYLPLVDRLLVKRVDAVGPAELDLEVPAADLKNMGGEFWRAYQSLDRQALFEQTVERLRTAGHPMTIGQLATVLPPTHDLETLSFWLMMARQAGVPIDEQPEAIDLPNPDAIDGGVDDAGDGQPAGYRFHVPTATMDTVAVSALRADNLE